MDYTQLTMEELTKLYKLMLAASENFPSAGRAATKIAAEILRRSAPTLTEEQKQEMLRAVKHIGESDESNQNQG